MNLDLLTRTSALLIIAWVMTRALPRATAATRHLIWHLAVVAVLLAPAIALVAPPFTVEVPSWVGAWLDIAPPTGEPLGPVASGCPSTDAAHCGRPSTSTRTEYLQAVASLVSAGTWLVGLWFLLGWLMSGGQAWRATAAPAEWLTDTRRLASRLGLSRVPAIRQVHDAASPRVAGLFRPVILVPTSATTWNDSEREAALLHELAHIQRSDRRTQAVAQIVCALYWFNPLTWIAWRALARERERACDDEVLKAGVRPSTYATMLLDLAKAQQQWTAAAALSMARRSTIEGRLLAILATDTDTSPPANWRRRIGSRRSTRWLVIAGAMVAVAGVLGAQQPGFTAEVQASRVTVDPELIGLDGHEDPSPIMKALTRALRDPDRQVRERAAVGLALVPGSQSIDPLLKALGDSDAQVREKAAIGLAFRPDPRVIDPLLTAMADRDAQVREKVAIALGATGDARAASALEKALDDPDAQVREKAASALVLLGLRR